MNQLHRLLREEYWKTLKNPNWFHSGFDDHEKYILRDILMFASFPYHQEDILILGRVYCYSCAKDFLAIFSFEWDRKEKQEPYERHSWPRFEYPLNTQGYLEASRVFSYMIRLSHLKHWQAQGQIMGKKFVSNDGYHHLFVDLPSLTKELNDFMFNKPIQRAFDPSKEKEPQPPHVDFPKE